MESDGRMLAASVIYRAPLESILDRKYYKANTHAAKYLRKLDMLAPEIENWEVMGEHGMYHEWLNQVHGKKKQFLEALPGSINAFDQGHSLAHKKQRILFCSHPFD